MNLQDVIAMQSINKFVTALNDPERIEKIREKQKAIQEVKKDGNKMSERSTCIKQKNVTSNRKKPKKKKGKDIPSNFKRINWLDYKG